MSEIRARHSVTGVVRTAQALRPIHDADDLHETDLDAELWSRLPEQPVAPGGAPC